jgi:hypothetical protein
VHHDPFGKWQSQVDAVADLIADGEIAAIDSTGTGRMVYEAVVPAALPYTPTAGNKQAFITTTCKRMVRGTLAMDPDGEGIDLLFDWLKRFQMMPTESGNWGCSGKRNGGDDRVFTLLPAVAGAVLAEHDKFLSSEEETFTHYRTPCPPLPRGIARALLRK